MGAYSILTALMLWTKPLLYLPDSFRHDLPGTHKFIVQKETNICRSLDPWAGSYYVESLTQKLAEKA